jgi:hypothetical protein
LSPVNVFAFADSDSQASVPVPTRPEKPKPDDSSDDSDGDIDDGKEVAKRDAGTSASGESSEADYLELSLAENE